MTETLEFVVRYGYALLFVWVLVEQAGLPIPAIPLLLASGALAAQGRMHLALAMLIPALASLCSDSFWYFFGKRRGAIVLNLLCRIALEPDSCVRKTETTFTRFGPRTLLICKFVPGLNTAAPTLSGMVGVDFPRFVLFDFLGALLWTGAYAGLGFLFGKQLDLIAARASRFGGSLLLLFVAVVIAYVFYRWNERRRFIEQVKGDRITPDELKHKLESGEPLPSLTCGIRSTGSRIPEPCLMLCRSRQRNWRRGTERSLAMGRSCCSVLDPTKRPAPGWRCNYASMAFARCVRCWADFTSGNVSGSRSQSRWRAQRTLFPKPVRRGLKLARDEKNKGARTRA
jgi:membrane protein DedA with SNARE-associated domain